MEALNTFKTEDVDDYFWDYKHQFIIKTNNNNNKRSYPYTIIHHWVTHRLSVSVRTHDRMHIYIYRERERERDSENEKDSEWEGRIIELYIITQTPMLQKNIIVCTIYNDNNVSNGEGCSGKLQAPKK